MFVLVGRRAQIAEVFASRRTASRKGSVFWIDDLSDLSRLDGQLFAAVWAENPDDHWRLPDVLLTADGAERDWLAWLVNFAPSVRPFTAYCRVVEASAYVRLAESFQRPNLGRLDAACVGLVLGEVLSAEGVLSGLSEPLTASACASALSFALVRALALYRRPPTSDQELAEKWTVVRQLTRQRDRGFGWSEAVSVVDALRSIRDGIRGSDRAVVRACQELADRGQVTLEGGAFGSRVIEAAHAMTGTREERVAVFERTLAEMLGADGSGENAFAIGYLASRINPGTLTHAALVAPALSRYPSAMMWYGVCAGLAEETKILVEFGGVGHRLLRELLSDEAFPGRPRADVSANELEVLLASERADEFPVYSPSQLSVELVPGVSTVLNWSSKSRGQRTQVGRERMDDRERMRMEYELRSAITRLVELHRSLIGINEGPSSWHGPDGPASGAQAGLFDRPSPARRGAKRR